MEFTTNTNNTLRKNNKTISFADFRKSSKQRQIEKDELQDFLSTDTITDFTQLTAKCCPSAFEFKKHEDYILIYRIEFDIETHFPSIKECIRIDRNLHVQHQCNGNPIPLSQWFIHGNNAKLTKFSMLEKFSTYIKNVVEEDPYSILNELQKRGHYKPKGRPPFSADLIRYALLLRYTSRQAYKLLMEKFPLSSFSLLEKIQSGGVGSIKAVKSLMEKGYLSQDCVLLVDEMYLQKGTQFHGGEYIGANENDELYKGIMVFVITGLKNITVSC